MAPKNNCRKKSNRRKSLQTSTSVSKSATQDAVLISAKEKKEFLKPYIDKLVDKN